MLGNFTLNTEQQACVDAVDGDYVVIAGPGTGKSTTLIQRHLHMLVKGVNPKDALNLTFTAAAAENMVTKVGLLNANKVFRTFHSFALELLKTERQHLPFALSTEVLPALGQDYIVIRNLLRTYPALTAFRTVKEKIGEWKCSDVSPEQAMDDNRQSIDFYYACAYRDYEEKCREEGWLDFDSMMKESVKLLESNDEVRQKTQVKYIAVDECQDTDVVQFKLLKLIYGGNIFVVGDENQLIYEWRSAQSGNLSNFSSTFPGAATLYLGQNYRSTKSLVEFQKRILPVDNGIASHMQTDREQGVPPTITEFQDDLQEALVTLSRITDFENTAIIARTNRQLLFLQKCCLALNFRSQILGRKNLWQQSEVMHLLKLGREKVFSSRPAHELFTDLIRDHNLTYVYRNTGSLNEKDPIENMNDIVKMAARRTTMSDFLDWLRRLTHAQRRKKPEPILTLTTVHQAKGREWKHVFVIGCRQGVMPHKEGEFVEERRIFFVACSRAADTLNISYFGNRSEFLNDFVGDIETYETESEEQEKSEKPEITNGDSTEHQQDSDKYGVGAGVRNL